jgi:ribosome modulation factor
MLHSLCLSKVASDCSSAIPADCKRELRVGVAPDKAWNKGFVAGMRREPVSSCPWKRGALMQSWLAGWRNGMNEIKAL